jgi:aminoglycoside phosphotransferase (APT) family kinase protein
MVTASGVRIGWADLPAQVRAAIEDIIGGTVVEARSQSGGFSPGTADRVRTADGRRAFVKAVSGDLNEHSPGLHRKEARIAAALPAAVPAPRLLGLHDDGTWVALVLQDVEGRSPATPWRADELARVLATLGDLARVPADLPDLPTAAETLGYDLAGWWRIAADPPATPAELWAARRLDRLCALADRGIAALTGDSLVHCDVRADNLLLGRDGTVSIVDWPWACRGPAWLDRLLLLVNVRLYGGDHDTGALLTACAKETGADPADLIAVLAALAGFFADMARRPPPPGLPTVRAFQRAQADAIVSWLGELDPEGAP